ncbi:Uncharacterized protein APZ42_006235 [Daphnia magna]|uniref:Uncharacterized protein n=1 Tax=Daphnia magna TaxID=35525 RepID=A0A164G0N9_9CRUS|nr:Uncharacterized protein APZ42_006235 [Daphnia magna]
MSITYNTMTLHSSSKQQTKPTITTKHKTLNLYKKELNSQAVKHSVVKSRTTSKLEIA